MIEERRPIEELLGQSAIITAITEYNASSANYFIEASVNVNEKVNLYSKLFG